MARRRVPEEDCQLIQHIYAEDPARTGKEVHAQFSHRTGRKVSVRKVYKIIQPLRGKLTPLTEEPLWKPASAWGQVRSEDMAFLLSLDLFFLLYEGVHLTQREARWGTRLRHFLDGEYQLLQMAIVRAYGARERAAEALGDKLPYTADLDALLQWHPWRSEKLAHLYKVAAEVGLIPALAPWEQLSQHMKKAHPGSYLGDALAILIGEVATKGFDRDITPEEEQVFEKLQLEVPEEVRVFANVIQPLGDDVSKLEASIRFHALAGTSEFKSMSQEERLHAIKGLAESL